MKPTRNLAAMAIVFVTAVVTGGWFLQQRAGQEQSVYFQARLFQEVVDRVFSDYVDPIAKDSLYTSAIKGVVGRLDPNSTFMEAKDYEDLRIHTQGDYGGVGLEITEREGYVTVVGPIPGSPGDRAGIRAGDQFVEIEGENAQGWEDDQAVERLRGEAGTDVHVKMRRLGVDQPIAFTLTREQIHLNSVPFGLSLPGGIAYVPLQVVRETSSQEVRKTLDSLRATGATKGFVLDLRGNPGGLLEQGIAVTDLYVPKGAGIVETRGRTAQQTETYSAAHGDQYPGLPIVVLVDERSASASEIISGALQDNDRALVVGMPSYGKGSVQTLFKVSGGNVLKLTTARWFTPLGRSIDKPHDRPGSAAQAAQRETGTVTLDGDITAVPVLTDLPKLNSKSGRSLFGGGGIVPDVIVLSDTMTTDEKGAMRALARHAGDVATALFNFAVRFGQEHKDLQPDFQITNQDLDRLYDSMGDTIRSEVDRATFMQAARPLRYDLELKITHQMWGDAAEFRRKVPYDLQLRTALDLLRKADSPESLFRAAQADKGR